MPYIVFEGPDFAGKSTLTKKVADRLGYRLVAEPFTESENSKKIKDAIINNTFNKETEVFLLAASRLEAFDTVITPNRPNGVIGDRSVLSTMVYQTAPGPLFSQLGILDFMSDILKRSFHDIYPDHIFFLDIDHDIYLHRLANCGWEPDEKEKALMDPDNWMRLKENYLSAIEWMTFRNPETKIHFITPETSIDEIVAIIDPVLLPE